LVDTFIRELRVKTEKPIKGIRREAMEAMWTYTWPGNIRELINALEYAFVTCSERVIDISNLPDAVLSADGIKTPRPHSGEDDPIKMQVLAALKQANGEKKKAAEILGISRQALWNRIRKYGIEVKKTITSR
jgi:two-component system response regulator HydG